MLKDSEKADKLKQSLPPGMSESFYCLRGGGEERGGGGGGGELGTEGGWWWVEREVGSFWLIVLSAIGLTMTDVPKKNKKGKRVA